MKKPERIQLRRKKGWKMPPNTLKVDRSTKWGNPFIVGKHGTLRECVLKFIRLCAGQVELAGSGPRNFDEQNAFLEQLHNNLDELKGKNLACWCDHNGPCHADVLLLIANSPERPVDLSDEIIKELLHDFG